MSRRAHQSGTHWPCLVVARPGAPPLGYSMGNRERVRGDARYIVQPGSQNRGPWQPSPSSPTLPCNPVIPVISSMPGEGEQTCAGGEHEQSLPAGKDMVG
jgi:hypothetical protein